MDLGKAILQNVFQFTTDHGYALFTSLHPNAVQGFLRLFNCGLLQKLPLDDKVQGNELREPKVPLRDSYQQKGLFTLACFISSNFGFWISLVIDVLSYMH
jgi:hypothetical protein